MSEVGKLKDLDVKPGDVVECVWIPVGGVFTVGKAYRMTDKGLECDTSSPQLSTVSTFRIISRANTQKLWRDMSDTEKGALLLAKHEGKVIEGRNETWKSDEWVTIHTPSWHNNSAYRVRPEPKVEVVRLKGGNIPYGYEATFNTIDGKPDCASIKMEAI